MSDITGTTTFAELAAIYRANASYAEDNSISKARAFVSACNALLLDLPSRTTSGRGGHEIEFDVGQISAARDKAQVWINANESNATRPRVRHVDLSNYRY